MSEHDGSWGDLLSGKNLAGSIALAGGVALHAINIYIATTVLPSVVKEIGGLELYAWNTTLFVVASILGSALTAKLLSAAGSRGAYAMAAVLFIAGSLTCALATNIELMLLGRVLQGLGGGFLFALGYAMIYMVFTQNLWPRAMALISGMWGVATLLGPAIGGVFAQMDAWRWAFGMLVPVTLVYMVLVWVVLPARAKAEQAQTPLALPQLVLLSVAVLVVSIGSMSHNPFWNLAGVAIAGLLMALFVQKERHSPVRLLPKNSLRVGSPLLMLYLTMGLLVIGMTSETFVPYFLQVLHNQSPLVSGYLAALMAAGWTLAEIWSSGWKGRGIRVAISSGPVLVLVGMVVLAVSTPIHAQGDWDVLGFICAGLVLVGFGIGLGWPHMLTRILQAAPSGEEDAAATSITTVQLFATALGSALAGMLANAGGLNIPGGIAGTSSAASWLFWVLAVAPLVAVLSAVNVSSALKKEQEN